VLGTLYVYKQGVGKPRGLFHHIFLGWATQRVNQHIPNVFTCLRECTKLYEIIRRNSMYRTTNQQPLKNRLFSEWFLLFVKYLFSYIRAFRCINTTYSKICIKCMSICTYIMYYCTYITENTICYEKLCLLARKKALLGESLTLLKC
jgi:hypothetical protein